MNRKLQSLGTEISYRKDRLEELRAEDSAFREELEDFVFWLDEAETLMQSHVDPTDRESLTDLQHRCKVTKFT